MKITKREIFLWRNIQLQTVEFFRERPAFSEATFIVTNLGIKSTRKEIRQTILSNGRKRNVSIIVHIRVTTFLMKRVYKGEFVLLRDYLHNTSSWNSSVVLVRNSLLTLFQSSAVILFSPEALLLRLNSFPDFSFAEVRQESTFYEICWNCRSDSKLIPILSGRRPSWSFWCSSEVTNYIIFYCTYNVIKWHYNSIKYYYFYIIDATGRTVDSLTIFTDSMVQRRNSLRRPPLLVIRNRLCL